MNAFDAWLTRDPREDSWAMELVERENLMDTDKETGVTYPTHIDELSCEDCDGWIGWSSCGSFREFYSDASDTHYKCPDCHEAWLDLRWGD